MVMGLEHIYLVSDVPGDVVALAFGAVTTPLLGAIGVLYRRQLVLEDRLQANIERAAASGFASAEALNKLTDTIKGLANAAGK